MVWIWRACLSWFGNLPLRSKLYLSFGWSCLFTVVLGVVSLTDGQRRAIVPLLVFILLLDLVMAWRLTHLITRPILDASMILHRLAEHDLTGRAAVDSTDEAGRMGGALNETIEHLREVLGGLRASATILGDAATTLSDETRSASENCRVQNDLAEKVLHATRRLSDESAAIAQSSAEAAEASRESAESAELGDAAIGTVAESTETIACSIEAIHGTVQRLERRSEEIGSALASIREISANTNLIALNAAIEAARAGEQGRGFAVVAGEVRRLAESARGATEEIEQMIAGIRQETAATASTIAATRKSMETGRQRSDDARRILGQIVEKAQRAGRLAGEIAGAAAAQSADAREIDESAGRVASLAAGSLGCSTEVATTGATLRNAAETLREVVGQFRL